MRTETEIIARINDRIEDDILGFECSEYLPYLSFENAKPFLRSGIQSSDWKQLELTEHGIKKTMLDYMPFAWEKANDRRGISSNRSLSHYVAWLWLSGDDEFSSKIERRMVGGYSFYGKPILESICEYFGWNWSQWDDGIRTDGDE